MNGVGQESATCGKLLLIEHLRALYLCYLIFCFSS